MDFISFKSQEEIDEYVIASKNIKFEYLMEMHRILEYIDYEDYIYGDLPSMIEEVYHKGFELKHEKKLY
jgi:guanylate kinase